MNRSIKAWLIIGLLLGTAIYALAEEITLTTYYPSPKGVYQELKTAGNLVVGDITNPPGARLHVVGDGSAPALRVDDVPSDTSPFFVDAGGNVGIGTASPAQKLHVMGDARVDSGQLLLGNLASDPGALGDGAIYYNTASDTFRGFQGGAWSDIAGSGFTNFAVFNSSDTFTVPPGVTKIMVEVWGGGGGGGGGRGSGGGGGGYGADIFVVTPGSVYSVTAGAGGAGGTGIGAGGAGGASSFGTLISATGGGGGAGFTGSPGSVPGSGGTSSAPSNVTGGSGDPGYSSFFSFSGANGGAAGGGGGAGGHYGWGACGSCIGPGPGMAPGGGGGSGGDYAGAANGAPGAPGRVIVWW